MTDSPNSDPAPEQPGQDPEPQPSELEARVAELLGNQQELAGKVQSRESADQELRSMVAGLAQKIDALTTQKPATPQNPFAPAQPKPDAPRGDQTLQQQVQEAVQQALGPILQQSTEVQQRTTKHQQQFVNLIQRFPELGDTTSQAAQRFHQLYNAREDLRRLDDAPSVIWGLVQGLQAQERSDTRATDERKLQATIPPSAGRKVAISGIPEGAADGKALMARYQQLLNEGRTRPITRREQGDLLNLKVALRHLGLV